MFRSELVIQDARQGTGPAILDSIVELAKSASFARIRVAVAYASTYGCKELVKHLRSAVAEWARIEKEWLISIDFGRTEPEALRYLSKLRKSAVRVPDGLLILQSRALRPLRCFHPKSYIFDGDSDHALGLFVGSANLTFSGLCSGVEHGTLALWRPSLTNAEATARKQALDRISWWSSAWYNSTPVDAHFLEAYEKLWVRSTGEDESISAEPFLEPTRPQVDQESGIAWAQARCFWIETYELYKNRGPTKPGNQLDCRRGTRVYFGFPPDDVPRNTVFGYVTLQYDDRQPRSRSVRYGNNQMDKVNLPIPGEDGPPNYDRTFVHFERTGYQSFRVSIAVDGQEQRWVELSQQQGLFYEFAGGRHFGFYS